ncbi:MAG: DUF815 domain-containing protein [Firmicutes bacterium]|nr:DUF815 domain-containing protein [Bacillota bacterium]
MKRVTYPDPVKDESIIGYEDQKRVIKKNTESFLAGLRANNILLYGERGTGKSSTVKSLLSLYGPVC